MKPRICSHCGSVMIRKRSRVGPSKKDIWRCPLAEKEKRRKWER